ncbi:2-C-methyl-D-erythritol 4-phosphate cytidylyltransferase [bacterium]|nr:2-C-methyl-D-erythritol 4-phosphate cytidylyltransferase [bacterium]
MKAYAIIVAAGKGERFGGKTPKPFVFLGDKPIIAHTIEKFEKAKSIKGIILVVRNHWKERTRKIVEEYDFKKVVRITGGGDRRQDSVLKGLKRIPEDVGIVAIHDGVRPFISTDMINKTVLLCQRLDAVVVGVPSKDTVKITEGNFVINTPDRKNTFLAQTPQVFYYNQLFQAYKQYNNNHDFTDDSQVIEKMGIRPFLLTGSYDNIKITTREDFEFAKSNILKLGSSATGVKKKRGRKKKQKPEAVVEIKKRGRPKKVTLDETPDKPKKRGRPKKITTATDSEKPRKRGRPKKTTTDKKPAARKRSSKNKK